MNIVALKNHSTAFPTVFLLVATLVLSVLVMFRTSYGGNELAPKPETEWVHVYPQFKEFRAFDAVATPDGGIIVACDTIDGRRGRGSALIRFSNTGEVEWVTGIQKDFFGTRKSVQRASLCLLHDGSIIVTVDFGFGVHRILRFDENGEQVDSDYLSLAGSVLSVMAVRERRHQNSTVIVGNLSNGNYGVPVIFNLTYRGTIRSIDLLDTLRSTRVHDGIIQTNDDCVLLYSSYLEDRNPKKCWTLLSLDNIDQTNWKTDICQFSFYPGYIASLEQNSDGNIIVVGLMPKSGDYSNQQANVLIIDSLGNVRHQYSAQMLSDSLFALCQAEHSLSQCETVRFLKLAVTDNSNLLAIAMVGRRIVVPDPAGDTSHFDSKFRVLAKLDTTGQILWFLRNFTDEGIHDMINNIIVINDSSYVTLGTEIIQQGKRNYGCLAVRKLRDP